MRSRSGPAYDAWRAWDLPGDNLDLVRAAFARALAALVPDPDREALMPFRIGYPTAAALAIPRRPAEEVIEAG